MRFLLLACLVCLAPLSARADDIRAAGGDPIDREALAARLAEADVIILGEVHDNPVHHENQAGLVARLAPRALVAEMMATADEQRIREHLAAGGDFGSLDGVVDWKSSGWPDWTIYRPIFEALPAGADVFGAGMPREEVRRLMTESAAALSPDPRLVPILERELPPEVQKELEGEMFESHCGHLPEAMMPMMVAGQRLRDASLAAAVLRARASDSGPVVVITGNGHARRDRGVPVYLAEVAPDLKVAVLGQIEEPGPEAGETPPFDFVWITPVHDREDPCETLMKRKD